MQVMKVTQYSEAEEKVEHFEDIPQELIDRLSGIDMQDIEFDEYESYESDRWIYCWTEDARDYYGTPTILFDLRPNTLIISDIKEFGIQDIEVVVYTLTLPMFMFRMEL